MIRKFLATFLLLGAMIVAMVGAGCQPAYYPYPNPYPTRPAWCQPGYECSPTAGNPSVYPPYQGNPGSGWSPPSDGYNWIWRDPKGLHVQFKARAIQGIKDAKAGGGFQEIDTGGWDKTFKSDKVGWGLGDGPYLVEEQAYSLRFGLMSPDGRVEGERFNFAFSHPGVIVWLDSRTTKTGMGVRRVGNADGSEAFVIDSTKQSIDP